MVLLIVWLLKWVFKIISKFVFCRIKLVLCVLCIFSIFSDSGCVFGSMFSVIKVMVVGRLVFFVSLWIVCGVLIILLFRYSIGCFVVLIIVVVLCMFLGVNVGVGVCLSGLGSVFSLMVVDCMFLGMFIYIGLGCLDWVIWKVLLIICGSLVMLCIR